MADRRGAVSAGRPTVAVCTGKDCRKRSEYRELRAVLDDGAGGGADVVETSCLDVCKGPVVIVEPMSVHPVVLAKVRSKKAHTHLRRLVDGRGGLTSTLEELAVSKSDRRTALKRLAQDR